MSDPSAAATLSETVNAPLPTEIAGLPSEDLAALDAMVHHAVDARAAAMDKAIRQSLKHAPRLTRPAIRKVLGL